MDYNLIYKTYKPKLIKLFSSKVSDLDTAEDLAQDTLLRVYEKLSTYDSKYAISTWIYSIAFNILSDHYRSKTRSPDISLVPELFDNEHTESQESPENLLSASEQQQKVIKAMEKLNKDSLESYVLKDISGMSYEDISIQLSKPINTIKSRVKRARDAINKALEV